MKVNLRDALHKFNGINVNGYEYIKRIIVVATNSRNGPRDVTMRRVNSCDPYDPENKQKYVTKNNY